MRLTFLSYLYKWHIFFSLYCLASFRKHIWLWKILLPTSNARCRYTIFDRFFTFFNFYSTKQDSNPTHAFIRHYFFKFLSFAKQFLNRALYISIRQKTFFFQHLLFTISNHTPHIIHTRFRQFTSRVFLPWKLDPETFRKILYIYIRFLNHSSYI